MTGKPVRVGRFEWERLMLSSCLPRPTKNTLLTLAVWMSAEGGRARPGHENLMAASGKKRSVISQHLNTAVRSGYLVEVFRGGHRGKTAVASEYAASVPSDVFARRAEILEGRPWKRPEHIPTSENPDTGTAPTSGNLDVGTVPVSENPDAGNSQCPEIRIPTSENPDPITQLSRSNPPLPPTEITSLEGQPQKQGGGDNSETLDRLVAELHKIRTEWNPDGIRQALTRARESGREPALIAAAARRCYADPGTHSPARLGYAGPWWGAARDSLEADTRAAQAVAPRCPRHQGQLAANCGPCRSEATSPLPETGPAMPATEARAVVRAAIRPVGSLT